MLSILQMGKLRPILWQDSLARVGPGFESGWSDARALVLLLLSPRARQLTKIYPMGANLCCVRFLPFSLPPPSLSELLNLSIIP